MITRDVSTFFKVSFLSIILVMVAENLLFSEVNGNTKFVCYFLLSFSSLASAFSIHTDLARAGRRLVIYVKYLGWGFLSFACAIMASRALDEIALAEPAAQATIPLALVGRLWPLFLSCYLSGWNLINTYFLFKRISSKHTADKGQVLMDLQPILRRLLGGVLLQLMFVVVNWYATEFPMV